jgi:L-fuculose-phosphate aldolase
MQKLRQKLLDVAMELSTLGLNKGASGNVSARAGAGYWITPSGMAAEEMTPDDMVWMNFSGQWQGARKPSSEWRFHHDILQTRQEIGAVIHTHAMFATTLACLHQDIPPFHYMIALAGGDSIRCAPYALFGTQALSDYTLQALENRKACLLANHGMVAVGSDLDQALAIAMEVENLCEQYWRALQIGKPVLLTAQEMEEVLEQFKGYGRWASQPDSKPVQQ